MNNYYVLLKGGEEGCDYTIGCNMLYVKLDATDLKSAKREVKEIIEYYGGIYREDGWEEIKILEVSKEINKVIPNKDFDYE